MYARRSVRTCVCVCTRLNKGQSAFLGIESTDLVHVTIYVLKGYTLQKVDR
jgi:hypothetical protein